MDNDKGLRFNEGKVRVDLAPAFAQEQYAKVLTKGAEKYADWNWAKGMKWSKVLASLERHLQEIKAGRDIDPESGLLHSAHIMCNAAFLTEYYKIYPQGDDRRLWYKTPFKRLWLDLDGVCADFEQHFLKYFNLPLDEPTDWNDYRFKENMKKANDNEDFWLSCPVLTQPKDIPYPISGYCTARECSVAVVHKWLKKNGFPYAEVINVNFGGNKVDALKNKADVFIDDSIKNFVDLNSNGILCFLKTRPHNIKYDVGYMRIENIADIINKI